MMTRNSCKVACYKMQMRFINGCPSFTEPFDFAGRYWLLLFRIKTNLTFAGIPAKLCSYTLCGIHNTFIGGVEKCIQRSPRSGAVDYNFKGKCYACLN